MARCPLSIRRAVKVIPTDLWRAGIVEAAMIALIDAGLLDGFKTKQRPAEG